MSEQLIDKGKLIAILKRTCEHVTDEGLFNEITAMIEQLGGPKFVVLQGQATSPIQWVAEGAAR